MDMNSLMLSFVFGVVGMGFFMYGKKAERYVTMGVGAGLMVVPYFITSVVVMLVVCGGLMVVPWVIKEG